MNRNVEKNLKETNTRDFALHFIENVRRDRRDSFDLDERTPEQQLDQDSTDTRRKKPADWVLYMERKPEPQKVSLSMAGKKDVNTGPPHLAAKRKRKKKMKDFKIVAFEKRFQKARLPRGEA